MVVNCSSTTTSNMLTVNRHFIFNKIAKRTSRAHNFAICSNSYFTVHYTHIKKYWFEISSLNYINTSTFLVNSEHVDDCVCWLLTIEYASDST